MCFLQQQNSILRLSINIPSQFKKGSWIKLKEWNYASEEKKHTSLQIIVRKLRQYPFLQTAARDVAFVLSQNDRKYMTQVAVSLKLSQNLISPGSATSPSISSFSHLSAVAQEEKKWHCPPFQRTEFRLTWKSGLQNS